MPRSETPLRSDLFPEISPYASGMLAVDGRHTIYWEQSGNPEGVPVVFLHGGPGAGSAPVHRRFFDPQFYRIVVFDQRGCGRSMPLGELQDNTTGHLVADMEKLRTHLGIPGWLLFGGPMTAVPLLLFAAGARRITLTTMGVLQYISPSLQFAIGVWLFHEPFEPTRLIGFGLIWAALLIYSVEGWVVSRLQRAAR